MELEEVDPVTVSLVWKLASLPKQIRKIFPRMESVTETKTLYEPNFVSIGATYRGQERLEFMEHIKLYYLRELIHRKNEYSVDRYVRGMRLESIPEQFKGSLDDDKCTEMLVVDGLFLIELFRGDQKQEDNVRHNLTVLTSAIYHDLAVDLILLHNQIPFTTLLTLFTLTEPAEEESLVSLAFSFFRNILLKENLQVREDYNGQGNLEFEHLLDLLHCLWCSSFRGFSELIPGEFEYRIDIEPSLKSVSELQKAGIKFKRFENAESLFNVRFQNKVFEIPTLVYSSATKKMFRNLIDHELYAGMRGSPRSLFFCKYIKFMANLITSPMDVRHLCQCRILKNMTSRDEDVSDMFQEFSKSVGMVGLPTYYSKVIHDIDAHCARRRYEWWTNLKTQYCSSPWRILKIIVATLLL